MRIKKIVKKLLKGINIALFPLKHLSERNRKIALIGTLFVILVAIPIVFYTLSHLGGASAAWFDSRFSFRQRVDITNSGSAQTDFQINFTLNTSTLISAGKMRADCYDIRVTDVGGNVLPHWIEEGNPGCNSTTTKIWTKMSSINTSGNTLYVYYGNPQASNAQSPDKIFILFDTFNGTTADGTKWIINSGTQTPTVSGGKITLTASGLSTSSRLHSLSKITDGNTPFTVESKLNVTGSTGDNIRNRLYLVATNFGTKPTTGNHDYGIFSQGTGPQPQVFWNGYTGTAVTTSNELKVMQTLDGTNFSFSLTDLSNQTSVYSNSNAQASTDFAYINFAATRDGSGTATSQIAIDWILVRKTAVTAPSVASPTNEESGPAPIAWWKLDEGTGTTTTDSSNNKVVGTLSGATKPTWQTKDQCVGEKCLYFEGSTAYVTTADKDFYSPAANPISISVWAKIPVGAPASGNGSCGSTGRYIVAKGVASNWEWGLENDNNNLLCAVTWTSAGVTQASTSVSRTLNDGNWHHYEIVLTSGSSLALYIDGILANSTTSFSGSSTNGTQPIEIGRRGDGNYFAGFVDELKIYTYARSQAQVKNDYNKYAGVLGATADQNISNGLVGYWKMDENTGLSASDSSGNSNTATLAGASPTTTTFYGYRDGYVNSGSPTYSTARAGSGLFATSNNFQAGQLDPTTGWTDGTNWWVRQMFVQFDTSSIDDDATITSATLSIYGRDGSAASPVAGDVLRARIRDYGTSVDTGDFVAGASLSSAGTQVASFTAGSWIRPGYNALTSDAAFVSNVNKTGDTRMFLHSKYQQDGTATQSNFAGTESATAGTDKDPKLEVTYTLPSGQNWTSNSKFGNAYDFESTSSEYAYAADSTSLSITGSNTLSAWIKPESVTASTQFDIIGKWDGSNESYLLAQYGDEIRCYIDSASNYVTTNAANLTTGTWYHVACSYDSTAATVKIYVNGVESASTLTGTIPSSIGDDAGRFHIGAEDSTTTAANFYDGIIDEARVHNRALSPAEVQQLYNFAPGPVGYWNMDEASGSTLANRGTIGSTIDGSLAGGATYGQGKYGKGISTDGSSTYGSIPDDDSIDFSVNKDFTVSFWMKDNGGNATTDAVVEKWAGAGEGYPYVFRINGSSIDFRRWDTTNNPAAIGTHTINDSSWHHVTGVKNGSTLYLFIDGVLSGQATDTTAGTTTNTSSVGLGRRQTGTNHWNGQLDELKIYNYARNAGQVVEDMNAGHPAPGSPIGSAVGHWKFDEGYGTTSNNSGSGGLGLNPSLISTSWTNNGKFSRALSLDGSASLASIPYNPALYPTEVTSTAWIYPTAAQLGNIVSANGNTGWRYRINSDLTITFFDRGATNAITTTRTVPLNQWSHIAVVGSANGLRIYINGTLAASNSTAYGAGNPGSGTIYFGTFTGTNEFFGGIIDEVKVYNSALTDSQVKLDYNRGQSLVLGAGSDTSGLAGGNVASNSASAEYCVPGDTNSCASPVGRWSFEEGGGVAANDTSGNANTGTVSSAIFTQGKLGKGLSFNGTSSYVDVGDMSSVEGVSAFTQSFWVKPTSLSTLKALLSKFNNGNTQTSWITETGIADSSIVLAAISATTTDGATFGYTPSGALVNGRWTHVEVVFDGTQSGNSGRLKIYINGVEQTLTFNGTIPASTQATTSNLRIGSTSDGARFFDGIIDDVKIYNYARSAAQVAWEYNQGKPVGHWKLDECQGATANDSSGNGFPGTITIGGSGTQTTIGTCSTSGMWNNGSSGKFNSSYNSDGTDDYISISYNKALYGTEIASTAWIYPTSIPQHGNIVSANGNTSWRYRILTDGRIQFLDRGGTNILTTTATVSLNTWSHVAVVGSASGLRIYINGNLVSSNATAYGAGDPGTGAVIIGAFSAATHTEDFTGKIDDVRIYNYALTKQQIRNVMNQGGAVRYGPLTGSP